MCGRKLKTCCPYLLFVSSFLCATLGVVLIFVFQSVIYNQVKDSIPLYNGSASYSQWQKPTLPIYMQFWFFGVTNAAEVLNGEKPDLEQIGPFTYREFREKEDIVFSKSGTITYRERKWFQFDRSMSSDDENATFTSVNLLTLGIASKLESMNLPKELNWVVDHLVQLLDGDLFRTYTVKEILWGYEDQLLKDAAALAKLVGIKIDDTLGLFNTANDTDDGLYTIYSGKDDISKFSVIKTWKNLSTMNYWSSKTANMINGTDGVTFPPFVDTSDVLYVFSSDICRSINFVYDKPTSLKGINLLRFSTPAILFANSTVNPANKGFCIPNCLGSGVLNMSTCKAGQPAIMSQPHFYQAANEYLNSVRGLHPSSQLSTVLDIEPHTGVALHAAKKLQINLDLHPVNGFTDTKHIKPVFLPMLWLNESASIDDDLANQFYNQVMLPLLITEIVQYSLIAVGAFGVAVVLLFFVVRAVRRSRDNVEDEIGIINYEVHDNSGEVQVQVPNGTAESSRYDTVSIDA